MVGVTNVSNSYVSCLCGTCLASDHNNFFYYCGNGCAPDYTTALMLTRHTGCAPDQNHPLLLTLDNKEGIFCQKE